MSALASTPSTRGLARAMSSRSSILRRSAIARLAGDADHAARRVVGGDDEHRPVGDEVLPPRPVGEALAIRSGASTRIVVKAA